MAFSCQCFRLHGNGIRVLLLQQEKGTRRPLPCSGGRGHLLATIAMRGQGILKGLMPLSLSISLSLPFSLSVKVLLYPGLHCVVFSLATPRCIGQKYLDSVPRGWPCDALCYPPLALGTGVWRSAPHFIGLDVGGVKDS